MTMPEKDSGTFNRPPRPEPRIDELLGLLAADWKASGSDQRFFQYVHNLQHRLGLPADSYHVEDSALIGHLTAEAGPEGDRPL